jgi:hypothetical protein
MKSNSFGSQIRNYVLDDRRVKDVRTGVETSNVAKACWIAGSWMRSSMRSCGGDLPFFVFLDRPRQHAERVQFLAFFATVPVKLE